LAGVLSGIAYYFNIDPLWIRFLYVLLFFGISILPSIAGFLFIAYIVMWIVVPASDELKEEKKIKKMYRDPDGKVLGGVSSGIAAYFGVDVVIIRLLFFASIFIAGTGLILYIIFWIILPEAKTLTDKMEMQGQPVTLSNIESNIKKSLKC
jgi:phage shock protein PspC (stress-responsive transcriptional regulator)